MRTHTLLTACLAVLALQHCAAQPAAEQAVGPATSPARAPGAFSEPLKVGVGLLSADNFPFSQKTANASAPAHHAGLEGFEVTGARLVGGSTRAANVQAGAAAAELPSLLGCPASAASNAAPFLKRPRSFL